MIKTKIKKIQEKITPKKLLVSTLFFCIFISIIGISWSYFTSELTDEEGYNEYVVETAHLNIDYDGGYNYRARNVLPGWTDTKTFTVTNNGNVPTMYRINWANLVNNVDTKSDLTYTITSTNEGGTMEETVVPNSGKMINIIKDVIIAPYKVQFYTITFNYKNRDADQTSDLNKNLISGKIVINEDQISYDTFTMNESYTSILGDGVYKSQYYKLPNMTWNQWINCGLNVDHYVIVGDEVKNPSGGLVKTEDDVNVNKYEVINDEYFNTTEVKTAAKIITRQAPISAGTISSDGIMKIHQPVTGQTPAQTEYRYIGGGSGGFCSPDVREVTNVSTYSWKNISKSKCSGTQKICNYSYYDSSADTTFYSYYLIDESLTEDACGYVGGTIETKKLEWQTGTKVNNYITFNDETWRIVGVFEVDDGTGDYEQRLRIIKDTSIGSNLWNSTSSNEWTESSLNTYLNGDYYDTLSATAKAQIGDSKWYTNPISIYQTTENAFINERGTGGITKSSTSGGSNVIRNTSWTGKIGLMYPSDYGYASSACYNGINTIAAYEWNACKLSNWLYRSDANYWMISPDNRYSAYGLAQDSTGFVGTDRTVSSYSYGVRPVVHLNSTVEFTGGTGTSKDPYTIK